MRRALIGLAAVALTAVAGCTGVPTSSSPEIIKPITVSQPASSSPVAPPAGANPREIVSLFLKATAEGGGALQPQAAALLMPEAKARFADPTITVIGDNPVVSTPNANPDGSETVYVDGSPVGSIASTAGTTDSAGQYLPVLQGDGTGGAVQQYPFTLVRDDGQWRISAVPPASTGLLITLTDFTNSYRQRNLYFYNLAGTQLVSDPRYTPLTDPSQLATWLAQQVVAGPSAEVQDALGQLEVGPQTSGQAGAPQATVTVGAALTRVDVPGASQLDDKQRNQLAGELAATLQQVIGPGEMTLSDNSRPVSVPAADGPTFTASLSAAAIYQPPPSSPVYYVNRGGVLDQDGRSLPGGLGGGQFDLQSVALVGDPRNLAATGVAGITAAGKSQRLVIGTGLRVSPTTVVGALSRPAWAPGIGEVWIGDGSTLYRVTTAGRVIPVNYLAATGAPPAGRIESVQLSPDGTRILLVFSTGPASAALWVGAVVRPSGTGVVSVHGLAQISPASVLVKDAAWSSPLLLYAVGTSHGLGGVYTVQIDGSQWAAQSTENLPGRADSVAVAGGAAWVSVDDTIWYQNGDVWDSPVGATGFTPGAFPTTPQ